MKQPFGFYYSPVFQSAQLDERRISLLPSLRALSGRTILFMTDLHASAFFPPRALERLIAQANALQPDLMLLGGDLAESARDQAESLPLLARLDAPLGVYTVMGNNDYHHTRLGGRALTDCLRDAGIATLIDSEAVIPVSGCRIRIAGLDVYDRKTRAASPYFADSDERDFRIVMAHYPQSIPLHLDECAAPPQLGLAGHTHGGQFRFLGLTPFSIGFERGRQSHLMPPSGWTDRCGFPVLVSSGVGVSRLPFRLNVPPQIHRITLE